MNLKRNLEEVGYYGSEELAMNMELLFTDLNRDGLSSVCLTGLPGVGKTFLPQSLAKVFGYEYISYTCDNKTGPEQLIEDMNIPQMVQKNAEKAISKGVLLRAIDLVNSGKKVILVIDEFDKASRETDFYFLEYLQSGKTTSATFGDVAIDPSLFANLIVFVCKNDERDVHEALMRRFNKFIEVEAPSLQTVRQILNDAVSEADEVSQNAILSIYKIILDHAEDYKKLATIQEMKNALREDLVLKKWEKSEDVRMKNMINHMVKFPEDRLLLNAKLTDMGLVDVSDELHNTEHETYSPVSIEQFFLNGFVERMQLMEKQVHFLTNALQSAGGANVPIFEQFQREYENGIQELTEEIIAPSIEEVSVLGTIQTQKVEAKSVLPKHIFNKSLFKLTKQSALYENEQYVLVELQLDSKKGSHDDLMKAITHAKTTKSLKNITHDGIVLAKDEYNQIGLIHYVEQEGVAPRILIVSEKPVLTDFILYNALKALPQSIFDLTKISELDLNVVTDYAIDNVKEKMDNVFDISEDRTEIIGSIDNVSIGYSEKTKMLKMKVSRASKCNLNQLLKTVVKLISDGIQQPNFNPSRVRILTVDKVFETMQNRNCFNVNNYLAEIEVLKDLETTTFEGNNFQLFAKHAKENTNYGIHLSDEIQKIYEYIEHQTKMPKADLMKQFAIVSLDGDNDYKMYKTDLNNNELDSKYVRYEQPMGYTCEEFVIRNKPFKDNSGVLQRAEELNARFEQQTA